MLPTRETTALDVYAHALSHGDRPVIRGADIDYDDVHDGVHYHADLLAAAEAEYDRSHRAMSWSAEKVAMRAMHAAEEGMDPRKYGTGWAAAVDEYKAARDTWNAAADRTQALRAKRNQDAAMAIYEVSA